MRKIKRWRYYCDFCNKAGGSAGYMKRHEESCTMNPDRKCQMCGYADSMWPDLDELKKIITNSVRTIGRGHYTSNEFIAPETEKSVMDRLSFKTECPACLLAAMRQTDTTYLFQDFDFKSMREEIWKEHNEKAVRESYGYY